MEVEISKAQGTETPASCMAEFVVEHVMALMTVLGIESISARKYSSGFGSRLHVSIAPFNDAPEQVRNQGIIAKDAIAQILSVANVTRVVMKPGDDDLKEMANTWKSSIVDAEKKNGSYSGSDSPAEGSDDSEGEP